MSLKKKNVSSILLVFISNHHLSCLIFCFSIYFVVIWKKNPYNFHLLITSLLISIHLHFPSPPECFAPRLVLLITVSVEALGFLFRSKKFPLDTWGKFSVTVLCTKGVKCWNLAKECVLPISAHRLVFWIKDVLFMATAEIIWSLFADIIKCDAAITFANEITKP